MNKCLVIIPAYNEEDSIRGVIEGIQSEQLDADILVVNDGSTDSTEWIARRCGVSVISHPTNLGYGSSLQTGYKFASLRSYPFIIQFDADGQHDPSTLKVMMRAIEERDSDIVIGSRFLTESDIEMNVGHLKRLVTLFFRFVICLLTGTHITDTTSGLRAVRYSAYAYYAIRNRFPAEYPDAAFLIQMLFRNYTISEIQTNMRDRAYGKSALHGGLKPVFYMPSMMLNILIVFIQYKVVFRVKNNA
ncbi:MULTISPECIES: glycosyltransferase family 2 protein [unclassified Paenibacillus]|uniref:glycosyltransferase family 2 protein n=1 Tax=unclassified Paenibacillus TaxID=185978 RepID=UPI001AE78D4C|nr:MULTISPECIES: glycosyltransferase family 2 protein [unclassified Paenibacillus]MBP1154248.1 glycosyltransferase involved in cell wall biosynthesis [Paenibacillus sp. PvP091]MBP1170367.1 glycosyltransferase involved in cell wall biosynthesis [Paenibacillus sp. PvR098]MBP2441395.1 glycosyltransferase involved in cell wall biosynthesis [Paenibacillus sp. PvP052]